jgi:hypothetical protein
LRTKVESSQPGDLPELSGKLSVVLPIWLGGSQADIKRVRSVKRG